MKLGYGGEVEAFELIGQSFDGMELPLGQDLANWIALPWSEWLAPHDGRLVALALRQLWFERLGVVDRPAMHKGRSPDELVCRCRGVYESELRELIRPDQMLSLEELVARTQASRVCQSCRQDVSKIWQDQSAQTKKVQRRDERGRWHRLGGMTPAEFILALDRELKTFRTRERVPEQVHTEILDLKGSQVGLKLEGVVQKESFAKSLEDYWCSALGVRVEVTL